MMIIQDLENCNWLSSSFATFLNWVAVLCDKQAVVDVLRWSLLILLLGVSQSDCMIRLIQFRIESRLQLANQLISLHQFPQKAA